MLAPRCFWRFLLTIVLVGSNLWSNVVCQDEYSDEVLKNMTSEELERICTVRGFEISLSEIDPTTGLPYEMTHEDFVEAAKQCLEIEREMNEILAEYPELAAEVEEELKKMEAERATREAEIEALKKELEEAEEAAERAKSTPGAAFVSSSDTADTSTDSADTTTDSSTETESQDDFEIVEDGDSTLDPESDSSAEEETTEEDAIVDDLPEMKVEDTEVIAKNETKSNEDFTLSALTFEMIRGALRQVESDLKRIVELVTPVIRPILRAGDVAWRHLKVAFDTLRQSYENSSGNGNQEESTTAS